MREKDEILYLAPADGVTKNRMIGQLSPELKFR